tara:strand:- start:10106 stop:10306 length:201 start_codon:yes stop_codon:yes gene_type:complete
MPKVGNRKFSYDPEGLRKAQEYAASTGKKVEYTQRYNTGGMVEPSKKKQQKGCGVAIRGNKTRGMI